MERVKYAFILFLLSVVLPSPIYASKSGINIGTNYGDANAAIDILNPGGWLVVILGGTGDCKNVQPILDYAQGKVNVVIRGHLNNNLTPSDALAWAATLGKLRTSDKLYFMPWNEPNQNGSPDYANPRVLAAYTTALRAALQDSGLRNRKIILLSPMLNEVNVSNLTPEERTRYCADPDYDMADFDCYVEKIKRIDPNYFRGFDGISMNLYDLSRQFCGDELCSSDRHYNPARFTENLTLMNASGMDVYGVESGTAGDNFYWRTSPNSGSPLYNFVRKFYGEGEKMFAIPSYDLGGEVGHTWKLIPSDVSSLIGSNKGGGTTPVDPAYLSIFNSWLDPLVANGTLIPCPDCGYAHKNNPGLCTATSTGSNELCNPRDAGNRDSRPVECQACNKTSKMTNSCATTMEVTDKVSWQRKDGDICSVSPNPRTVETTWGGDITLNYSDVTIPFVGKKGRENGQARPANQGENGYLADYFDGTSGYYLDYRRYWLDVVNYSGVLRKLTPMVYQDQLKTKMIQRVNQSLRISTNFEGKVHDYKIAYTSRLCWDAPFWLDFMKGVFERINPLGLGNLSSKADVNHFCLFDNSPFEAALMRTIQGLLTGFNLASPLDIPFEKIDGGQTTISKLTGRFPPSPTDPDYNNKWLTWKYDTSGKWGRFWEVLPVTSRENTEGKITPYLAGKTGDKLEIKDDTSKKNQITKVPHVARLYESSFLVNQSLKTYPKSTQITLEDLEKDNTFASLKKPAISSTKTFPSANSNPFVREVLAAGICPPDPPGILYPEVILSLGAEPAAGGEIPITWRVLAGRPGAPANCNIRDFNLRVFSTTDGGFDFGPGDGMGLMAGQPFGPGDGNGVARNLFAPVGTTEVTVTAIISGDRADQYGTCEDCPKVVSASCTLNLITKVSTCGVIPPPQPSCFQQDAPQIDRCIKDPAITDSNPNDKLCCGNTTIKATLTAKDVFENNKYLACEEEVDVIECYGKHWIGDIGQDPPGSFDDWRSVSGVCVVGDNCTEALFGHPGHITNIACLPHGKRTVVNNECYRWVGNKGDPLNPASLGFTDPADVNRKIGVTLSHPYLSKIWQNTAGGAGVFDNFRPYEYASFKPIDAYSQIDIGYVYTDTSPRCFTLGVPPLQACVSNDGLFNPGSGKFYYPYLGGIQFSKLWMKNTLKPRYDPSIATPSGSLF